MSDSTLLHKGWYAWIGQKVCVRRVDIGLLKYFGEIKSRTGFWCGVEFDEPIGKTDGVIDNVRYFKCKANHGIFVPMHEVARKKSRSIELRRLSDLSKFKSGEACFADNKKPQTKLDTTFDAIDNKNIQNNSGNENSETEIKHTDFVDDKRHVNVCKRSKNSYSRFGTEESLGILSNLLDEDDSWNLLDHSNTTANEKSLIQKKNDEIENDSVFSPPVKTSLYSTNKPHIHGRLNDNPIQNYFNIKCTSTPKQCLNNIFDLGATVKLDHDKFYDSLHEEIEPIIAGSSGPKSMDYDLTKFKHNEILCSTSKLTIPLLPNDLPLCEEVPCMKEDLYEFDRNKKDVFKEKDRNCLLNTAPKDPNECFNINQFSNAQGIPKNSDILNATYEVNDEILKNPTVHVEVLSQHLECESNAFNSDKKSNGIIDLNSTFVLYNDSPVKELQADKTFVMDQSPVIAIEHTLPTEAEINFEKKSLSIIFEKASNENLSIIGGAELVEVCSPNISSQKPDGNRILTISNHSSKSIDKLANSLNSSMKIADKEPIASDLNSTFCINSDDSKKSAHKEANKRHSLSYGKNNLPVHKEVSNIAKRKSIKQPQSFNTQKTVFKVPDSHVASTSSVKTNIIKKSTVTTFVNKKVEVEGKTVSKDSSLKSISKLSLKDNLKTKCSSSDANVTEQFKKSLNSCKTLYKQTRQEENARHVALKITENNSKITSRRYSIGGLETKVISKISYTSNKISIAEHSNVNRKINNGTDSHGLNSKNLPDKKHNSIKRRHTMLPTILSNGVQARRGLAKSKSDLSNNTSTAVKSRNTIKDTECVQSSKTRQDGFGNKKENSRYIYCTKIYFSVINQVSYLISDF